MRFNNPTSEASSQRLNTELLKLGAHTSGSYARRVERLRRFLEYGPRRTRAWEAKLTADLNQRGKFNQSERSAAWALTYLREYKTESRQSATIPTSNATYGAQPGYNVYYLQTGSWRYINPSYLRPVGT
jgi:hypothetical protein